MRNKRNFKKFLSCFLIVFSALSILFLSFSAYFQLKQTNEQKTQIIQNEKNIVSMQENIIDKDLSSLLSDIIYQQYVFQNYDDGGSYQRLEENLAVFLDSKKIYYKIQYIDVNGTEKIRVNYNAAGSYASKSEELGNKANESYFINTIHLGGHQVLISKIGLDTENNTVSLPEQPVIKSSVPVFAKDGNLKGIIVLSYNANKLIEDYEKLSSFSIGSVYLLNDGGYWIINQNDTDKQWGFIYDDKMNISFKNQFPAAWKNINKSSEGTFSADNGFYIYKKITPFADHDSTASDLILGDENLFVVIFMPNNIICIDNQWFQVILYCVQNGITGLVIIFLISIALSLFIGTDLMLKMKTRWGLDALTQVYNRRSGLSLLRKLYDTAKHQKWALSICFIRINNLKQVNETFGYSVGDGLVLSVRDGIKTHIRKTDLIIRLRNDIFLTALINVNYMKAEEIRQRIEQEYQLYNETGDNQFLIHVSYGIIEFKFTSNENVDKIIDSAI